MVKEWVTSDIFSAEKQYFHIFFSKLLQKLNFNFGKNVVIAAFCVLKPQCCSWLWSSPS